MSDEYSRVEEEISDHALESTLVCSAGAGAVLSPSQQPKDVIIPLDNDWSLVSGEQLQKLADRVETTIDFDNGRGDLTLVVRNDADEEDLWYCGFKGFAAFKVSLTAMARASPFWEKVFHGPFAEAQPGHTKVLNYIEDDPASLQILLNAIHLRFNRVPLVLSLNGLAKMAVLTDKFRATSIVGPWIQRWLERLDYKMTMDTHDSRTQWAWISWEYGLEDVHDLVHRKICMTMSVDENGVPLTSGGLPPTVEDKAKASRKLLIQDALDGIYRCFNELRQVAKVISIASQPCEEQKQYVNGDSTKYCEEGMRECIIVQFGSFFCGLENCGLWPEMDASEILMSPQELREKLERVRITGYHPRIRRSGRYSYSSEDINPCKCGPLQGIFNGISESSPILNVSEEQRGRLAEQRRLWAAPVD